MVEAADVLHEMDPWDPASSNHSSHKHTHRITRKPQQHLPLRRWRATVAAPAWPPSPADPSGNVNEMDLTEHEPGRKNTAADPIFDENRIPARGGGCRYAG